VLFGSYVRGEAGGEARGKDSDVVDLLVLLEGEVNGWQEYLKIEPVSRPLSLESGYVLSILSVTVEAYKEPRKPFIMNARQEGVSLV
jgi:predicted nucleotidyltransferase